MASSATAGAQMRLMNIIGGHMAAEYKNDVDLIMDTVAPRPRYVMGGRGRPTVIYQDLDAVRAMYSVTKGDADLVVQKEVNRIVSDWYLFGASHGHYRHRGVVDGVDRAGVEYTVPLAAFLPVGAEDALLGEFVYWACTPAVAIEQALGGSDPSGASFSNGPHVRDIHDETVLALKAGEPERLRELYSADAQFITRDWDDPDGGLLELDGAEAIVAHHTNLLASAPMVDVTIMTFVSSDWYVFAEHAWTFTDEHGESQERRTAGIYSRDHAGRLATYFGYGADERG
jgi:hypothetical protein